MFSPTLTLIHLLTLLALLPAPLLATTHHQQQQPPLYTATLHHLPVLPTPSSKDLSPHLLAILTYHPLHPHLSTLTSFTPPPNNTADPLSLTQIAIYLAPSSDDPASAPLRTSATATNGFYAPYKGRFRLMVQPETGDVVGASWSAWMPEGGDGNGKVKGKGRGDFDIVTVKKAPVVIFDKPVKGKGAATAAGGAGGAGAGTEGEGEEVEKTFLQK